MNERHSLMIAMIHPFKFVMILVAKDSPLISEAAILFRKAHGKEKHKTYQAEQEQSDIYFLSNHKNPFAIGHS